MVVTPGPAGGRAGGRLVAFALVQQLAERAFQVCGVAARAGLDGDVVGVAANADCRWRRADRGTVVDGDGLRWGAGAEHQGTDGAGALPRSPSMASSGWSNIGERWRWAATSSVTTAGGVTVERVSRVSSLSRSATAWRPALIRPWPIRAITPSGPAWPAPRPWARPAMVNPPRSANTRDGEWMPSLSLNQSIAAPPTRWIARFDLPDAGEQAVHQALDDHVAEIGEACR
ncbi:Uncharacterised protein [Pseudomonas aeruginosa]|nr:Uncharacterised protein [Pseudomonas aeruginosa]